MKHPIALAFGIAVLVTMGLLFFMPFTKQEAPWAIFFILLTFPFTWFFVWLITNGISWWQDMKDPDKAGSKDPPQ